MAAVGLVTNYMNQKSAGANNERQAKMAAAQAQYSPWTGMKPDTPKMQPVDEVGGALTGAAQGALSGAMMKNAQDQNKLNQPPQQNPMNPNDATKATLYDAATQNQQGAYTDYLQSLNPGQRRT